VGHFIFVSFSEGELVETVISSDAHEYQHPEPNRIIKEQQQ